MKLKVLIGTLFIILLIANCKKDESKVEAATSPVLSTNEVYGIKLTSATFGGNISNDGGKPIITRGICWGTQESPTIEDSIVTNGDSIGFYSSDITNLSSNTTYYVRAFATNSIGTSYGNEVRFTTYALTDIDNNYYHTVAIGTQTWLKENLKTTRYQNGDNISNPSDNTAWTQQTTGAYCWYNNNENMYKNIYGALYNYYAVVDNRNVCPSGWHVPTEEEWATLVNYIGGKTTNLGGKLKATSFWVSPNIGATDSLGFTALPGGYRYNGNFSNIKYFGIWWLASDLSTSIAWNFSMYYDNSSAQKTSNSKNSGYSVRCLKDL